MEHFLEARSELPANAPAPKAHAQAIDAIRHAIGDNFVRPATATDAIDGVIPQWIAEPASIDDMACILKTCDEAGLRIVGRGGGTKLDWGHPPRAVDVIISTRRLDRILEHAAGDMTATVQAGCTLTALGNQLAQRGQRLALDALWPERATVGGIIATHDSGALRGAYGTLRDHLIGLTVVLADGTIARSGGKVVKNVAGYDLPKLFTGSFGTLGIIAQATFRLYSIPRASQTIRLIVPTTDALGRLLAALMNLSLVTLAVQFDVDLTDPIGVSVLVGGLSDAMEAKLQRVIHAADQCGAQIGAPESNCWSARERLFSDADDCVLQISLLPTQWPSFIDRMRKSPGAGGCRWRMVAQSIGVGAMCIGDQEPARLAQAIKGIRVEVENSDGSLIVLRCPTPMKAHLNVWPDGGDALPLMRRIKAQFDARSTLSPGRFVGGI